MDPLRRISWPVSTERLALRPATEADLTAVWGYRSRPEVTTWMTRAPLTENDFAAEYLDPRRLARTLVIELRQGGPGVVGDLMLRVEDAWSQVEVAEQARDRQAEIGWCLAPAYAGQGYATEAARELLRICFEDLAVHRVIAACFAENTASSRLMERLGMRRETHARQDALHRSGRWLDSLTYALLAREWIDLGPAGA